MTNTKPYDPHGAIVRDQRRRVHIANTLGGLHVRFMARRDGAAIIMGRECRLDTGKEYLVTRAFQPIDRRQVREQANWMLLLDALGFDMPPPEGKA